MMEQYEALHEGQSDNKSQESDEENDQ